MKFKVLIYSLTKVKRIGVFFLISILFAPLYALSFEPPSTTDLSVKVVVNLSVANEHFTLAELRAIFAMRKTRWSNGSRIHVFVLPDIHPLLSKFT
jgi:hypothetical protein